MMVEILSPRVRCTVISIGNGIAYGIFGGLLPLIAILTVPETLKRTGSAKRGA